MMNNKDFISELSHRTGRPNKETQEMVNTLLKAMGKCFEEGNSVEIKNVGVMEVRKHNERVLVNTTTHERKLLPPKVSLLFRPVPFIESQTKK